MTDARSIVEAEMSSPYAVGDTIGEVDADWRSLCVPYHAHAWLAARLLRRFGPNAQAERIIDAEPEDAFVALLRRVKPRSETEVLSGVERLLRVHRALDEYHGVPVVPCARNTFGELVALRGIPLLASAIYRDLERVPCRIFEVDAKLLPATKRERYCHDMTGMIRRVLAQHPHAVDAMRELEEVLLKQTG
ncbi:MAG: hypothetical protein AAGI17_02470 [Planctomycetota bacterium]